MLSRTRGFSLTELMIGTALGLMIIAGALQLYVSNIQAATDSLRGTSLNQELRTILSLITRELRRSGYWAGEPGIDTPYLNPFQSGGNALQIGAHPAEAAGSCVLYSYDLNADKQVGVGTAGALGAAGNRVNLEQFGVRLRNGRVQLRQGGRRHSCAGGRWQTLNTANTDITQLQFELIETCIPLTPDAERCESGAPALLRRQIECRIGARQRQDENITQHLNQTVYIANDKLISALP